MKLQEKDGDWCLALNDGAVQLLQIDWRLGIFIFDAESTWLDSKNAKLCIGQSCHLKGPDDDILLIPGEASTLAPILPFFNAKVISLSIEKTGYLKLEFGGERFLEVYPDPQFEAWDLFCPSGWLICNPGGSLEFFPPAAVDVESLSKEEEILMLGFLAHELTVSARGTYEAGTDKVLAPEMLRRFNELQHRVTGSVRDHLMKKGGIPLKTIVEMIRGFGKEAHREDDMEDALKRAAALTAKHMEHVP